MPTLLEEARATFRATVWVRRTKGLWMGWFPLYWISFKCVKEDGVLFNTTNWLILTVYYLIIFITSAAVFNAWPLYVIIPLCLISGAIIGRVFRWVNEP